MSTTLPSWRDLPEAVPAAAAVAAVAILDSTTEG